MEDCLEENGHSILLLWLPSLSRLLSRTCHGPPPQYGLTDFGYAATLLGFLKRFSALSRCASPLPGDLRSSKYIAALSCTRRIVRFMNLFLSSRRSRLLSTFTSSNPYSCRTSGSEAIQMDQCSETHGLHSRRDRPKILVAVYKSRQRSSVFGRTALN